MNYYVKRYGPITASLAVLFASGLAAGYRWGQRSVSAGVVAPAVTETAEPSVDRWIAGMATALQKDLALTEEQTSRVREAIAAPAEGMFTEKRQAAFKIHLRLLQAHDVLAKEAGLNDKQQTLLKVRREQLRRHIIEKFKDVIGDKPDPILSAL